MVNMRLIKSPVNWMIVFFMLLIPALGLELILNRRENGCDCSAFK